MTEPEPNNFKRSKRIQIPLVRRIFPQLITDDVPVPQFEVEEPVPVPVRKKRRRQVPMRSIDDDWGGG